MLQPHIVCLDLRNQNDGPSIICAMETKNEEEMKTMGKWGLYSYQNTSYDI